MFPKPFTGPRVRAALLAALALAFFSVGAPLFAQSARPAWETVPDPKIVSVAPMEGRPETVELSFSGEIGPKGADSAVAEMRDASGAVVESKKVGRSSREIKAVEFSPPGSGEYTFVVRAARRDAPGEKASAPVSFAFSYPLSAPLPETRNLGGGAVAVSWRPAFEATAYRVAFRDGDRVAYDSGPIAELSCTARGLTIGVKYSVSLEAIRGGERALSAAVGKTVRAEADREWRFAWFGQSTKASVNRFEMLDPDAPSFRLTSCSVLPNGDVDQKGGKYTAFHDGVSFYYTVIDPDRENFSLTATFTVDYVNPAADGQEGFGLVAMDSLGENGVSGVNHYTNSAGIIATKFEETIAGAKKTSKDTLGARFVTGMTPEILALGDSGIAEHASSVSRAYSYAASDLIRKGDSWRITLKKDNTGYRAILEKEYATEGAVTEYTLYGPDKLRQLDRDRVYLGFTVARGCNATVTDVDFAVTDPRSDPPAEPEPPELVPLVAAVDSPSTSTGTSYRFAYRANADGTVRVTDRFGKAALKPSRVKADADFFAKLKLSKGVNDFVVTFDPDPSYSPGPGKALAHYDRELARYVEGALSVSSPLSVALNSYPGKELYVTPDGSFLGKGTRDSPLDLHTAIGFAKPGQPIILAGGEYFLTRGLMIERGRDGTARKRMELRSAPGERAILDFSGASAGMAVWGDFWRIDSIDVRNTRGDVKGLQIAGNDNVVSNVRTHDCGDTGLQISGSSLEPREKWPSRNLITGCESFGNRDPAENNADGFAAKLTCGEGNAFRNCVAWSNIDDGWDLFAKIETGPIGAVTIENCVAYRNGSLPDGSGNGDGNGFKLGGDGIAVPHVLRNSVSFANGASGITSNSNPALRLENCVSYGNSLANINLYGKGSALSFSAAGCVSMAGGSADVIPDLAALKGAGNFFWTGTASLNAQGVALGKDAFASVDTGIRPEIRAGGTIDMHGLLSPTPLMPKGSGANLR